MQILLCPSRSAARRQKTRIEGLIQLSAINTFFSKRSSARAPLDCRPAGAAAGHAGVHYYIVQRMCSGESADADGGKPGAISWYSWSLRRFRSVSARDGWTRTSSSSSGDGGIQTRWIVARIEGGERMNGKEAVCLRRARKVDSRRQQESCERQAVHYYEACQACLCCLCCRPWKSRKRQQTPPAC